MIPQAMALQGLILAYGAGTLGGQVLILRELLVLCQGQELKLALGLWCWLFWTGLGSLGGGRLVGRLSPGLDSLGAFLFLLGWLLPGTVLGARLVPGLLGLPAGQSLGPGAVFFLFVILLAPFGLTSGIFFPFACAVQYSLKPEGAAGRVYATEALGAALGIGLVQIVLMGRYANLALALGAGFALVSMAAFLTRRPGWLAGVLVVGLALYLAPQWDLKSRQWQFPGQQVAAAVDSPYALLTVTRENGQLSFFANHIWHFTHPDPYSAEHAVHLALLQHPRPERVLLLGGGVAGLVPEILKHPSVNSLQYVELDPDLIRLGARFLPEETRYLAGNPKVQVFFQDGRRFLALTGNLYDVILLNLPEPTNAQLNRGYSLEFFRIVLRHLSSQGVFSFAVGGGGGAALHPSRAAYLALHYNTLHRVFPEVVAFPGDRVRFFASPARGVLTADPQILLDRLKERQIHAQYVREYYLLAELAPPRQQFLSAVLRQQPPELNSDLNPRGFFYDLVLTGSREGLPWAEVLFTLKRLPRAAPWLGLGALFLFAWMILRKGPAFCCLMQVLVMGLGAIALEVAVLVLYQVHLGSLYRQLGLLLAAFMLGMAAGGAWRSRRQGEPRFLARRLAGLQLGLAALALALAVALIVSERFPSLIPPEVFLQGGFFLLLALAGFAGGGIFSLSATLWRRTQPAAALEGGLLYAVDLLGATLGTLGMSLLILPVWGLIPALMGLAALHTFAAAAVGTRL